jgi:hypothetical protein
MTEDRIHFVPMLCLGFIRAIDCLEPHRHHLVPDVENHQETNASSELFLPFHLRVPVHNYCLQDTEWDKQSNSGQSQQDMATNLTAKAVFVVGELNTLFPKMEIYIKYSQSTKEPSSFPLAIVPRIPVIADCLYNSKGYKQADGD